MFEELIAEIYKANAGMHDLAERIATVGIIFPNVVFYDNFNPDNYSSDKEIIVEYLLIKRDMLDKYYDESSDFGVENAIFQTFEEFDPVSILEKVFTNKLFIHEQLEMLDEQHEEYSIDDFFKYLYSPKDDIDPSASYLEKKMNNLL